MRTVALAGARVAIEVEDNGPGIPKDVLPRVFDPFFTTKPVGQGTGLGLAISHDIVTSFGGELSCSTEPGKGTIFRITLDAAQGAAADDAPPPTPKVTRRGRVLVIDDEPGVLRTIERTLREEQDVTCMSDSREALKMLIGGATEPFDVVFCDLMMPHANGMQVYEEVRAHDEELATSFVFMSGGAIDDVVRSFLGKVSNERLEKPFSNGELRAVARRYVEAHR